MLTESYGNFGLVVARDLTAARQPMTSGTAARDQGPATAGLPAMSR